MLEAVCAAREDGVTVSVSGLDEFDIGDFGTELADAQTLLGLGIESPTLKQQIFQKLAFKYLCDVRQDVKEQIANEIESRISDASQITQRQEEAIDGNPCESERRDMSEQEKQIENASQPDIKNVVRHVIEEFMRAEQSKAEPAYKAELIEERRTTGNAGRPTEPVSRGKPSRREQRPNRWTGIRKSEASCSG